MLNGSESESGSGDAGVDDMDEDGYDGMKRKKHDVDAGVGGDGHGCALDGPREIQTCVCESDYVRDYAIVDADDCGVYDSAGHADDYDLAGGRYERSCCVGGPTAVVYEVIGVHQSWV